MQAAKGITYLSKNASFSDSNKVFCKISNAIHGSNTRWRGRGLASSIPSESAKPERGQKRISKDERRAVVETFVNNYRALNAGKYPTPSETKRQVGGCYYVVKKIIQELEYQFKTSPITKVDQHSLEKEEPEKVVKAYTKVEEVSSSDTTVDLKCHVKDESSTVNISSNIEAKQKPQVSTDVKKSFTGEAVIVNSTRRADDSNFTQTFSDQIGQESDNILHTHIEKPQDNGKEAAISEGSQGLNGLKEEVVQEAGQEDLESDKLARDISNKESEEDPVPERSTFWGNLRSFADGVIKLWKKN